ncbi:polyprenol monophosphomannose synthase [Nocardiopsis kunsanensis]|uniref:Polyprenol monophosphomannose synthase n=1 Tax=Nocardiopsis kunsanensis TaxID=141693 RepID=A0A918X7X1_9ACTN|nr:polyprenol monophosphomannose synthase [Nocardiopsis kunsanensis]GHD16604.1 polyprenol monophosphomannose synthase [Nocardiopsis kunsanensis]
MPAQPTPREQPPARVTPEPVALPEPWSSSRVAVVVPTYDEAENLPRLVAQLTALDLPRLTVVVVDDNSPDGTGEIADKLAAEHGGPEHGRVSVVHRTHKDGLGRAYVEGMTHALDLGAEYVVQMDADLSHPVGYVPQLLGALHSTNADVVIGSRYVPGGSLSQQWGLRRRLLSGWANTYVKSVLSMPVRDVTAGFKIWRSSALRVLDLPSIESTGYAFQVEMHYRAYRRGQKLVEIPIHFEDRVEGRSKLDAGVALEAALRPLRLRRAENARH